MAGIDGGGMKGIDIQQAKLNRYEGNKENAELNSKGKFNHRNVRKLANATSYLTRSHDIQVEQGTAQKTLNQFRIKTLTTEGDAHKAAQQVSGSNVSKNEGGALNVDQCPELEDHIEQILKVADHKLAKGQVGDEGYTEANDNVSPKGSGKTRHIVDTEKFAALVKRDLTTFLGNTIKTTDTPHGLDRLRRTVDDQQSKGHITEPHAEKLKQLITKQYTLQLKNFPAYLQGLSPKDDSAQAKHELAREKLEAIHEMTVAVSKHSGKVLGQFHHQLKMAALASFSDCAEHTSPHPTDLKETSSLQSRIQYERNQLLTPVLAKTSGNVEARLAEADRSTATARATLQTQMDEIPGLEKSMQDTVITAIDLMKQTKKQETRLAEKERELHSVEAELIARRNKTGRLRVLNPSYQRFRTTNLKAQNRLRTHIATTQADITQKRKDFLELQARHTSEKQELKEKQDLYGESVQVLAPPPPLTGNSFELELFIAELDSNSVSSLDEACLHYHLNSLADNGAAPAQLNVLAREYVAQINDQGSSARDALANQYTQGQVISQPASLGSEPIDEIDDEWLDDEFYASDDAILSTEQLAELEANETPASDEDLSLLIAGLQEATSNPYITEDHQTQLSELAISAYTDLELPKAGVQELSDRLITIQELKTNDEPPLCWQFEDLFAGFKLGIEALRQGKNTEAALDAMDNSFVTDSIAVPPESDTDSTFGGS